MEVLFFLFLVLVVFPRFLIKSYKDGKEESERRTEAKWDNERHWWEVRNTLSFEEEQDFFKKMYDDYKKEIDVLCFLYPPLKSPPSRTKTLRSLTLSQIGKIDRRNAAFAHNGLQYRDYEDEISYELFVNLVFYIDKNLKKHGMNEPLLVYRTDWVYEYDNLRQRSYSTLVKQIYTVNEKDIGSLIERKFDHFLWEKQLWNNELKEIKDYPY